MKQIGARQAAGRIGGIGPCGRELCCATWMTNFVSVSTSAARFQDISLNPQKLAGQCAKLKCCLNYEVDAYVECQKRLPSKEITLETLDNVYYYFKADILKGMITYSTDKSFLANEVTISARRAFEVLNMNKRGEKPEKLDEDFSGREPQRSKDLLEQESLTRFDKTKAGKNRKKKPKSSAQPMNAPVPAEAGNSNNVQTPETTKERERKAPQARNNRPHRPKGNSSSEVPQVSATAGSAAQAKTGQEPRPSRNNRKNFRRNNNGNNEGKRPERNTNTDVQA